MWVLHKEGGGRGVGVAEVGEWHNRESGREGGDRGMGGQTMERQRRKRQKYGVAKEGEGERYGSGSGGREVWAWQRRRGVSIAMYFASANWLVYTSHVQPQTYNGHRNKIWKWSSC